MSSKKKWLIKNSFGKVLGPYSTEEVIKRIKAGRLSGDESISLFPGYEWIPISQEVSFYDHLLEILEAQSHDGDGDVFEPETSPSIMSRSLDLDLAKNEESINLEEDFEVVSVDEVQHKEPEVEAHQKDHFQSQKGSFRSETPISEQFEEKGTAKVSKKKSKKAKEKKKAEDLELKSARKVLKKQKRKKSFFPVILMAVVIFFGALFFLSPSKKNSDGKIRLGRLKKESRTLTKRELEIKLKKGINFYTLDKLNDYLKAQEEFLDILSTNKRHQGAMEALCMTYFELWPYAKQDSKDIETLSLLYQQSTKAGPFTHAGYTCRVVYNFLNGNYDVAKSYIESGLDKLMNSNQPPISLYYLKSRVLEGKKELLTAVSYSQSAQNLWPAWIAPHFFEAYLYYRSEKYDKALRKLRSLLSSRKNHAKSRILLGIVESKGFRHFNKAKKSILWALKQEREIPPHLLSEGYLVLAEIYFQEKNKKLALKNAIQAYKINPNNKLSENFVRSLGGKDKLPQNVKDQQLVLEGDQFVREGDLTSAQAHYVSAYQVNKQNATAAYKAAKTSWDLNLSSDAIKWLNRAIQSDSKLVKAYALLVDFYTQRYDFESAGKVLSKISKTFPKSHQVMRSFALVELRRHNYKAAVNYAKRATEIYPMDIESQIIYAKASYGLGDYEKAYGKALQAIEIDENNAEAHKIYAQALGKREGVEVALSYIKKKVREYPLNSNFRMILGDLYLEEDYYNLALKVYHQLTQIQSKPKKALVQMGKVYRGMNQLDNALESFLNAAVMDPSDSEPLFEAGKLYLDSKKYDDAIKQFERVLQNNELYPFGHFYLGKVYLMKGGVSNYKAALKFAEMEKKKNPGLSDAYILAAESYYQLKQYERCAGEYQQASKYSPNNSDIYIKLARCYRLQGNLDVARSMLNRAAKIESGNSEIYKEYGALYELEGDLESAIRFYQDYFKLEPNAPDKDQIMQRLQNY